MCVPWQRRLIALAAALLVPVAVAGVQTVCTVTVNSADEKEVFRRFLPAPQYRFVELVERGRPDWLRSACRAGVSCDVLIISGHYDGRSEFFSDRLESSEFLPVDELERAACSDACPGLLSRLKTVYLFGCNTLNPKPQDGMTAEAVRGLVREGRSPKAAERELRALSAGPGSSSRDRMRQVFKDVPVIYGFPSLAPVGPVAADTLERYFRARGSGEVASPHPSGPLLGYFAPYAMSFTEGSSDEDEDAQARDEMCRFADERRSAANKLAFVHQILQRGMAQTLLHLERSQRLLASLDAAARQVPAVASALAGIAHDSSTSERFLEFARGASAPELRVRLFDLAHGLGWLSAEQRWEELARMLGELQARTVVGLTEVNLACTLNQGHDLDGAFNRRVPAGSPADSVPHAAVRACLGSAEGHARALAGLFGADEADARIAQAYLRHRPITDAGELRRLAGSIAEMAPGEAQVRALEALARHYVSDPAIVELLTGLYAQTPSAPVQAAIAGILIRADRHSLADPQLLSTLRAQRRPSAAGDSIVDALIRRLQAP